MTRPLDGTESIEDERPEPLTMAEIAEDYGVSVESLRAALRQSSADASPSEVADAAREIEAQA